MAQEIIDKEITKVHFTVAVTGHRDLKEFDEATLDLEIEKILRAIDVEILKSYQNPEIEFMGSLQLEMVSGLAFGADIKAHECLAKLQDENALTANWRNAAIIPYSKESYVRRWSLGISNCNEKEDIARFNNTYDKLAQKVELCDFAPPKGELPLIQKYVLQRRYRTLAQMLVRRADLLLAIWNGEPSEGAGGTADVVQEAHRVGVPIIWIKPGKTAKEYRIFGISPQKHPELKNIIELGQKLLLNNTESQTIEEIIQYAAKIAFPIDIQIDSHGHNENPNDFKNRWSGLKTFTNRVKHGKYEIKSGFTIAIFYELLIWLLLLFQKFKNAENKIVPLREWKLKLLGVETDNGKYEWSETDEIDPSISHLKDPFIDADKIATRLGHIYRSGYVLIYFLAGLAVLFALIGLLIPEKKQVFVFFELASVFFILVLFLFSTNNQWHKRWLNARQLSETLRTIRILNYLGFTGRRTIKNMESWVVLLANNYAAQKSESDMKLDRAALKKAAAAIKKIMHGQAEYHHNNHARMAHVHKNLEILSGFAVVFAFIIGLFFLIATFVFPEIIGHAAPCASENEAVHHGANPTNAIVEWLKHKAKYWATFFGGVAPAIATVFTSIRFQGDFERFAERSKSTLKAISALDSQLNTIINQIEESNEFPYYEEILDAALQAQEILEADLEDWRFVYAAKPTPGL